MIRLLILFVLLLPSMLNVEASEPFIIDAKGVGPIKLGMTIKELPTSVEGLYDKVIPENSDMVLYSFILNGETVMTTNGDECIELIEVFQALSNVVTEDGIHSGSKLADLKAKNWEKGADGQYSKNGVTVWLQEDEVSSLQTGSYEAEL